MNSRCVVVMGLALAAGSCGPNDPIAVEPAVLTGTPSIVETFSGTLGVQGAGLATFTVNQGGQVNITLVSAGPPATITVGLGVGTPAVANTCSLLSNTPAQAGSAPQLAGPLNAGTYCVEVYDVGNVVNTIQWTITVAHP